MSSPRMKHVRHAVWATTLAIAATGLSASAWAQAQTQPRTQAQTPAQQEEDDVEDHILNADKRLLNAILSPLGLGSDNGPAINYRERSPLVVPQGRDLPVPGKAVKTGDWPVEPEVKEKRAAAAARKSGKDQESRINTRHDEKPISGTSEMWKTGNTGTWGPEPGKREEPGFFSMLMEGKLKGSWTETGKFEGEPPRTSLIDPPAGYLTPSPAAPYGVTPRADEMVAKKEPKL